MADADRREAVEPFERDPSVGERSGPRREVPQLVSTRAEAPVRGDAPTREREPASAPSRPSENPRENRAADEDNDGDDDGGGKGGKAGGGAKTKGKKRTSPWVWIILALVVAGLIAGGVMYWLANKDIEDTDDAYTDGNAVSLAAKVSGYVIERDVNDNQFVKAGQVIVKIDPRDYQAALDQAQGTLEIAQGQLANAQAGVAVARKNFPAQLASARAQALSAHAELVKAQADARRQHAVSRAATTQQQVDDADAALLTAQADVAKADAAIQQAMPVQENIDQRLAQQHQLEGQVAEARAQVDQAKLNLGYATITAPQDGWITKRNVDVGSYLTTGATMLSLVAPDVWVTANFKETQLNRMRPGQKVTISVDAYPGLKLQGHVDSVQLGSGSKFSAFPAENATGNYVKIVQRVPVKIDIDSGLDPNLPLPLGISVYPSVTLK